VNRLKLAFVSFGFLGLSPFAPGTAGTLGGVLVAWLLRDAPLFPVWIAVVCVALYAASAPLGAWAESYAGRKDPGIFVVDEVIGYLLTIAWTRGPSPLALAVAFFVFRFFDVLKPPPARRMERIGGGHGILLDDVFAGLWGLVVVMLPARLLLDGLAWTAEGAR
jgi:phosphatidylglycerophosphatase A